jgi:hypothetical protein
MPKQNSTKKKQSVLQQSSRSISTELLAGIPTQEEREEFERAWRNSTYVLDRLKAALERKMIGLDIDKPDDYDNPSWAVKRADRNGELRALKDILRLLP